MHRHPLTAILLAAAMIFSLAPRPTHAAVIVRYAAPAPIGLSTGDCLTWETACTLVRAIAAAQSGEEIWVQAGTYTPGTYNRRDSFILKDGVALYGGFLGGETERDARDWAANVTTLSGDIGIPGVLGDNSIHVVTGTGLGGGAALDGFTITGGYGDRADRGGGGLYLTSSSPVLANLIFTANTASLGGGMYLDSSSPALANLTFTANMADRGGGLYLVDSSPTLTGALFTANTASDGGALCNGANSAPILVSARITGNTASNGGAAYVYLSDLTLVNSLVAANSAADGGGIFSAASNLLLNNVTLAANRASARGGGIFFSASSSVQGRGSIVWGNTAPVDPQLSGGGSAFFDYSDVQDAVMGTGNIAADPLFERLPSAGADGAWNTADDDTGSLRLGPTSPAINSGNDGVTDPGLPAADLDGNLRVVDGAVDMGAYENQHPNHAPVLSGPPPVFAYLEDAPGGAGATVSSLLDGQVADVDGADVDGAAAAAGMAIYAADNSRGEWQVSRDDGVTWTALSGLSEQSALLLGPADRLRFVPAPDANGSASFSFRAWDGADLRSPGAAGVDLGYNGRSSAFSRETQEVPVIVKPVNDPPTFTPGADVTVLEDSPAQVIEHWAAGLSAGPENESAQGFVGFTLTSDNPDLFDAPPALSLDGALTFTPALNAAGSALVTVTLQDDGGKVDGGVDTSAPQTFTITILPANDVSLSLSAGDALLRPGGTLLLGLTAANDGVDPGSQLLFTVSLPDGLTFLPEESSIGCTAEIQQVTCPVASIDAHGQVTVSIAAEIAPGLPAGTPLHLAAAVTAAEPDGRPENNQAELDVQIAHQAFLPAVLH